MSKIRNKPKPQNKVVNNKKAKDEHIQIDLSNFNFKSIKVESFTNFLKDKNGFKKEIDFLFHKAIPNLSKKSFKDISRERNYHYHKIKDDELELTKKILKKYNMGNYSEEDLLQIGCGVGSLRFVGERSDNNFKVYFIDFHHLIYPSEKYNSTDYMSHCFCILNLDT